MPKWPSIFLVAMTASVLTLVGSSLVPGGEGSRAAQPLPCGITVDNPCPPLLRVTAPSTEPKMTLTRGKYLVWLDGHGRMRQVDPGLWKLSGCLLYRDRGTASEAVVLDPFRDASLIPTNDLESHSELYKAVNKLRERDTPISREPPATLPIILGEIHFRFPYQPVLVEVPVPTKGGVQPPTVQPPTDPGAPSPAQQSSVVLSATCKVRLGNTPRGTNVESARIYALRLE